MCFIGLTRIPLTISPIHKLLLRAVSWQRRSDISSLPVSLRLQSRYIGGRSCISSPLSSLSSDTHRSIFLHSVCPYRGNRYRFSSPPDRSLYMEETYHIPVIAQVSTDILLNGYFGVLCAHANIRQHEFH